MELVIDGIRTRGPDKVLINLAGARESRQRQMALIAEMMNAHTLRGGKERRHGKRLAH